MRRLASCCTTAAALAVQFTAALAGPPTANVPEDRRILVSELRAGGDIEADAVVAALKAARAMVRVSEARMNGQPLNSLDGTGKVYGHRCYVLTALHNVNKSRMGPGLHGDLVIRMDPIFDPTGATVQIEHAPVGHGERGRNTGTVIAFGSVGYGLNGDWAVIRLDLPSPVGPAAVFLGEDHELQDLRLMSIGLGRDRGLVNGRAHAVIDPACRPIHTERGILTDCLVAPGDSGGDLLAKVTIGDKTAWGAIGMTIESHPDPVLQSHSGQELGRGRYLNLATLHSSVLSFIKADLATKPACLSAPAAR